MPEGDTIFRTARALNRALLGKPVTRFRSTFPFLTRFDDDTPLAGQTVEDVESRGKWVLIHFSGGGTLATHMLMSGSWHIYRPGERWQRPRNQMRIVLENSEYVAVGFSVPVAKMLRPHELERALRIPSEGIECLSEEFERRRTPLRACRSGLRKRRQRPASADCACRRGQCLQVGDLFHDLPRIRFPRLPILHQQRSKSSSPLRASSGKRMSLKTQAIRSLRMAAVAGAQRTASDPGESLVGVWARRPTVPSMWRADSQADAGPKRTRHVLVSPLPAHARRFRSSPVEPRRFN